MESQTKFFIHRKMNSLRLMLKKIIPKSLRQWIWDHIRAPMNLAKHQIRDALRFYRYNLRSNGANQISRQAMMYSHMLEKGLSMRDCRPFFGKDVVEGLSNYLRKLENGTPTNSHATTIARSVLLAYEDRHSEIESSDDEKKFLNQLRSINEELSHKGKSDTNQGGIILLKSEDLIAAASQGVAQALRARHSVRMYEQADIPNETINNCLEVAGLSPSACNLQPTRIYVVQDKPKIQELLTVQGGARGFYTEVPLLFILTYEISFQIGPRSRMQGYTDTGLFAQSLMLALLEEGIGSCPLNWAQEIETDRKLRKVAGIAESENIVMLISAGYLPEDLKTARSSRSPIANRVTYVR
jgi:nitroreductase